MAQMRLASTGSGSGEITARLLEDPVETFDFAEVSIHVPTPVPGNPFTDAEVTGTLREEGAAPISLLGFCDSDDGTLFRIRFLARRPGTSSFTVRYSVPAQGIDWSWSSSFRAVPSSRKGIVIVDPERPYHFRWSGTGEHYFYSGATAYHLLSWRDDPRMLAHLNRIADAGANRIRFLNYGRASDDEWWSGMTQSDRFVWTVSPWAAENPQRQLQDGSIEPVHTRFDLAHWRKAEKLLRAMRARDVVGAVNLYMDRGVSAEYGPDDAPEAGSFEEELYFRYAVARYSAFANVMWDLGTEHDEYRTSEWATAAGTRLREWDPYGHLVSAHPNRFRPEYQTQPWYGFAEFQYYGVEDDGLGSDVVERVNRHVRGWRDEVRRNGRILPQVEEEYGYEADPSGYDEPLPQVRKKAWAIVLGGGYVTSGERRGWQHGDPTNDGAEQPATEILGSMRILREFFASRGIPFRDMEPMAELDGTGRYGLAQPGEHYVILLPDGGSATVPLAAGAYTALWLRPKSGQIVAIPGAARGTWRSPAAPPPPAGEEADGDWVLYLRKAVDRRVDFAPPGSAAALGFEADGGGPFSESSGFGWVGGSALSSRLRSCPGTDPAQSSFVFTSAERTWELELANGDYDVTVSVGDCAYAQGPQRVVVEGTPFVEDERTASGSFLVRTRKVRVMDGRLSVTIGGGGGVTALDFVEVVRAYDQPGLLRSVSFQAAGGRTPLGFVAHHGEIFDPATGLGFTGDLRTNVRTRGVHPDPALDGLVFASERPATFEVALPAGTYDVRIAAGDRYAQGPHRIVVEGVPLLDGETTAAGGTLVRSARVYVADGRLTVELGGTTGNTTLNYLTVFSAPVDHLAVNFQPATSLVPAGFAPDAGAPYSAARGYGWSRDFSGSSRMRGRAADPALDTFVFVGPSPAVWKLDLPNGLYQISVAVGDPSYAQGPQRVVAEGVSLVQGETTAASRPIFRAREVRVSDGQLSIEVGGLAGNTALDWIRVVSSR